MRASFWHRVDIISRQVVPAAVTLGLLVVGLVPLYVPGFARVVPAFALIAVFHWGIYRPELLPVPAVFLIGAVADALTGTPFGLHSLIYLAVYGAVTFQHGFFIDKSFAVMWLVFSIIAAVATVAAFVLLSVVNGALSAVGPALLQFLSTVAFFPVLSWGLSRLHRLIPEHI